MLTPEEEARAVRRAEVTLVCIYGAAVISGLGGVWAMLCETIGGMR